MIAKQKVEKKGKFFKGLLKAIWTIIRGCLHIAIGAFALLVLVKLFEAGVLGEFGIGFNEFVGSVGDWITNAINFVVGFFTQA